MSPLQHFKLLQICNPELGQWYPDGYATTDIPYLITIFCMTFKTGLFNYKGLHKQKILLPVNCYNFSHFSLAFYQSIQGCCFPLVSFVGYTDWIKAFKLSSCYIILPGKFIYFIHHQGMSS